MSGVAPQTDRAPLFDKTDDKRSMCVGVLSGQWLPWFRLILSGDDFLSLWQPACFIAGEGGGGVTRWRSTRNLLFHLWPRSSPDDRKETAAIHWWVERPPLLSLVSLRVQPVFSINEETKKKKRKEKRSRTPSCSSLAKLHSDCQALKN